MSTMRRAAPSPQKRLSRSMVQWSTMSPSRATGTAKRAVVADDAQVAGQRELHPEAHARAVDRRDRRDGHPGEVVEHLRQPGGERDPLELGEVGPGAEVTLRAGDHEGSGAAGHSGLDAAVQ